MKYKALLTQLPEQDPTAIELVNTIGDVTLSKVGPSTYNILCEGAFPEDGTFIHEKLRYLAAPEGENILMIVTRVTDDVVQIITTEDGWMNKTPIEIDINE